jgi:hypothetical protein
MSSPQAAPGAAVLSPLRAEASRRNGAKSCGPKTAEGKARSAQNALKHGSRAQKHIVLPGEDAAEFAALEAALIEELAPDGALQSALAQRVVSAVWRLSRAERLEAELFAENQLAGWSLGHAMIRDCNGARSFDTLLRYRGGTLAELWRALRTLKALQAEQAVRLEPAVAPERLLPQPHEMPIEPEARGILGDSARRRAESEPPAAIVPAVIPCDQASARTKLPDEPESCRNPGNSGRPSGRAAPRRDDPGPAEPARPPLPTEIVERGGSASLLAGTALVPPGRRRWA